MAYTGRESTARVALHCLPSQLYVHSIWWDAVRKSFEERCITVYFSKHVRLFCQTCPLSRMRSNPSTDLNIYVDSNLLGCILVEYFDVHICLVV